MWSSRPYIPPAPFISGERAGLEFWFTLATLAGSTDTSTRRPPLFAHSRLRPGPTRCDLLEHLAHHPPPLGAHLLLPHGVAARGHHAVLPRPPGRHRPLTALAGPPGTTDGARPGEGTGAVARGAG